MAGKEHTSNVGRRFVEKVMRHLNTGELYVTEEMVYLEVYYDLRCYVDLVEEGIPTEWTER